MHTAHRYTRKGTHCSQLSVAGDQEYLSSCSVSLLLQLLHLTLAVKERRGRDKKMKVILSGFRFFKVCFCQPTDIYLFFLNWSVILSSPPVH